MAESSGEKSEQPTQKKIRDARKKGQVAKSQDLSSSLMLVAAVAVLWLTNGYLGNLFKEGFQDQFKYAVTFQGDFTKEIAMTAMFSGVKMMAFALAPILGVLFITAFAVNFLQVGAMFSFESIQPNLSKINPADSFKQKFFKMKPYLELGKTMLKMIITAIVVTIVLTAAMPDLIKLMTQPVGVAAVFVVNLILEIFLKVGLAFIVIGGADFFLQHFLHKKELMMTKQEVKQEYKEMEGDPYIKSKRRHLHREIIAQSLAASVQKSSVVIANPTHLAIALRYEQGSDSAPVIVAKGADFMAAQMRQIADESNVPIMRDVPLARALYEFEVDDEIPEELYEAVAVVLRWVSEISETH
ncbi:MAG: type III secretion system export apparatus subunit SctU [Pyrinomonadaceae bacterium]|nr:type III secretion system export apparatus subunit SctU [Pyrinomonadaceae bacterium]